MSQGTDRPAPSGCTAITSGLACPLVELRFTKLAGGRFDLVVRDRKGPDVALRAHASGPALPHDLVHAAVERALQMRGGFCAALAAGDTFEGFEPLEKSRHRRSGLKVLKRRGDDVLAAELVVGWAYRVWAGLPLTGRGVTGAALQEPNLSVAVAAIDEMAGRWAALAEGDTLVVDW